MLKLLRAPGPECPQCGCGESECIHKRSRVLRSPRPGEPEKVYSRWKCGHCANQWTTNAEGEYERKPELSPARGVGYRSAGKVACPSCHSTDTIITSTRTPIRHHKCRTCSECFKSFEEGAVVS